MSYRARHGGPWRRNQQSFNLLRCIEIDMDDCNSSIRFHQSIIDGVYKWSSISKYHNAKNREGTTWYCLFYSSHLWRMKLGRPYLQMAAFAPELESHQLRAEGVATEIYEHLWLAVS